MQFWEKSPFFGHTSFIKVVLNGTIATKPNAIPHEDLFQAAQKCERKILIHSQIFDPITDI